MKKVSVPDFFGNAGLTFYIRNPDAEVIGDPPKTNPIFTFWRFWSELGQAVGAKMPQTPTREDMHQIDLLLVHYDEALLKELAHYWWMHDSDEVVAGYKYSFRLFKRDLSATRKSTGL